MLRLPTFEVARPTSVAQAVALLAEHGPRAMVLAGGTDLVPNLKHKLFEPELVVAIGQIAELHGIRAEEDAWVIGACTTLREVAESEALAAVAPALVQAVSLVAGPQLRNMGTLGGNVLLDTRCQWYNQTYFWRQALGFCLKKDGTACHVVEGGSRCVAAASNDSAPALMTLDAELVIEGPEGRRTVRLEDFWLSDGIYNKKLGVGELLVELRIPATPRGHLGAYGKLRERGSIDFPLLGVAARLDLGEDREVRRADLVLTALQARPVRVRKAPELLVGTTPGTSGFEQAVSEVGAAAHKQCRPLANIPGDESYRHAMVPVYVRRTLLAAAAGEGPVHHL